MKQDVIDALRAGGVRFEYFHPLHWYSLDRVNNRTHRKLLIVDGQVAFNGGVGIADAWEGNGLQPDRWRDMQFRVAGPAAAQMRAARKSGVSGQSVSARVDHGGRLITKKKTKTPE